MLERTGRPSELGGQNDRQAKTKENKGNAFIRAGKRAQHSDMGVMCEVESLRKVKADLASRPAGYHE